MPTGVKYKRTGRYVRRQGWTHDDYRDELMLLSVEDDSIFTMRPELGLTTPCRVWIGQLSEKAYGVYGVLGENRAQRVSHVLFNRAGSPLPKELQVCHRCDVRNCIEPTHLWEGTNAQNAQDMSTKGRNAWQQPEVIERMAPKRRGRPLSEEHKKKISLATTGKPKRKRDV